VKLTLCMVAVALPALWLFTNHGETAADTTEGPQLDEMPVVQNLPLVYDVENTGAHFAKPGLPSFEQLPSSRILPDPFRSISGGVDVSFANWSRQRNEVKASIEQWEIGPKPDRSDVDVAATYRNDSIFVVVTRRSNGKSVTIRSPILRPAGDGPFPAVIGIARATGSLPEDIFTRRGIARIAYLPNQLTTVTFNEASKADDPFYQMYPEFEVPGNHGQYAAWSWGVSRLIDGMQIVARQPGSTFPIDLSHLAVTGCSYAGKMALFAGALDERIALTIAQESGGGGMPAWRASEELRDPRGDVERAANTNGAWFMRSMKSRFQGDDVYKFPHDHHQLMAMIAPRALLATNNSDFVWLSNPSAYISARATQEIYTKLGIPDRFGFIIDGGYGHCEVPASHLPVIEAFVDKYLLGLPADTGAEVHVYPDLAYHGWMPWALRNDLAALVAAGSLSADHAVVLRDMLEAALSNTATGRTDAALNEFTAFTNQVSDFVDSGALTREQGAVLVARIDETRTRIGA
jgi:hypothetical protein